MNHVLQHSFTIARFTVIEAIRNRLLWLALVIVIGGFGFAEFLGDLAITEHRQIQVSILSSFLRISSVVLIALIVVTSAMRELQDKTLELILSLAISRSSYFFGKLLGFSLISLLVVALIGLVLFFYADAAAVLFWLVSLFCEILLVTSLCLVMLFTFKQIPSALAAVFLFYALARSIASMQLIAEDPIIKFQGIGQQFINGFIDLLAWLLPSLHHFAQTKWLVYNSMTSSELINILLQTLIYLLLLSGVALFDFYRKNFNS